MLTAATDDIIASSRDGRPARGAPGGDPRHGPGGSDAIDAHPWVGTQLSSEPWQPAMLRILESVGGQLQAFGVAGPAQFDCASALVFYILGLAGQYAAAARLLPPGTDRSAFLAAVAAGGGSATPRSTRSCTRWRPSWASTTTASVPGRHRPDPGRHRHRPVSGPAARTVSTGSRLAAIHNRSSP